MATEDDSDEPGPEETSWFDAGPYPFRLAFVPCEAAWDATMGGMGEKDFPYPEYSAACSTFEDSGGTFNILVTLNVGENVSHVQVLAGLAHEATHVMQYGLRRITTPGMDVQRHEEIEAYLVQWAFQCCASAWLEYQKSLPKSKRAKS